MAHIPEVPGSPEEESMNQLDGAADENGGETWFGADTDNASNDWNFNSNVDTGASWGATAPEEVEGVGLDEMTNEQTANGEQGACHQ